MARVADHYAIPHQLHAEGVRRYGFHGLSYEYIAKTLPQVAPEIAKGRVIVAHLGSGASMCALKGGRSVESTMGFTALDGLPMGTRPGQIDPGVVLYLLSEKGMSASNVQNFLYRDCGLKGLSGVSNDMRELEASEDPNAKLAVEYFVYRVGLNAGMLAAALQGLDAFVFTAGIGENSVRIRARIAEQLGWLGVTLDPAENSRHARVISRPDSRIPVYVIPTDEELMIAQHTLSLLVNTPSSSPDMRGCHNSRISGYQGRAEGQERSDRRHRQRPVDRLGLRQGVSRARGRSRRHLSERTCQEARRAAGARAGGADLHAARCRSRARRSRCSSGSKEWGQLDFLLHSIAFSPKEALHGRVVDVERDGFLKTMDVSCWSFMRMAHLAEPLMKRGGTMFTMTYYGSQMVVENYNVMGVAKAALEAAVRYIAAELGPKGIRVHAISPGPLATRAASGIPEFDELMDKAQSRRRRAASSASTMSATPPRSWRSTAPS